jgi:hypothetical protein
MISEVGRGFKRGFAFGAVAAIVAIAMGLTAMIAINSQSSSEPYYAHPVEVRP